MEKTAVEWLVEQLIEQGYFNKDIPKTFTNLDHLTHQAKEMEKIQMEDFFCMGILDSGDDGLGFNHYYNETFKSE